jgi:hypothetical protein
MAKRSTSVAGQFVSKQSAKADLDTFRAVSATLRRKPAELRALTVRAGISTPTGKLKKAYGG